MNRAQKPLQVLIYQDVLCAWCFIAESRLEPLRREFGDAVRWEVRPYPLRIQEALPTRKEIDDWVKEIERARKEPEGAKLSDELWTAGDPPLSSVTALAALEAAKLQGDGMRLSLARSLQRAALEQGVNVARPDVVFEMASAIGLNMNRFTAAYESEETRKLIIEEHHVAADRGVKGVPTLVIGGKWMVSGLREAHEYREHIVGCLEKLEEAKSVSADRILH
jgi:predicted DsbA family dithiol-disulfide isomerase